MAPFAFTALLGACASEPEIAWVPSYCYRSLADVQCYLEPDQGREARLVGVQIVKQGDPALASYWLERHRAAREEGEPRVEATLVELEAWRGTPVPEPPCKGVHCTVAEKAADMALGLVPVSSVLAAF